MTPDLSLVWAAVYAVAYMHGDSTIYAGPVTDDYRAQLAATHADRAVAALQQIRPEAPDA